MPRYPKRSRAPPNPLEAANKTSDVQFVADYLEREPTRPRPKLQYTGFGSQPPAPQPWTGSWTHPRTGARYAISLVSVGRLRKEDLEQCFRLVEATSRRHYELSSAGWHPTRKRAEMLSPGLRYMLVREEKEEEAEAEAEEKEKEGKEEQGRGGQAALRLDARTGSVRPGGGVIRGYASLMLTYEFGQPVVYCYEIHLEEVLRGTGLARTLMGWIERVAANLPAPVERVMLTCFVANERALRFYRGALGFERDENSPQPRELRYGKVFVPDYVVLSKRVVGAEDGTQEGDAVEGGGRNAGDAGDEEGREAEGADPVAKKPKRSESGRMQGGVESRENDQTAESGGEREADKGREKIRDARAEAKARPRRVDKIWHVERPEAQKYQ